MTAAPDQTIPSTDASATTYSRTQLSTICISVLVIALCGIVYELLIATVSSYLVGNSVYQFSITVGLFMAAMGIGSYLSKHLHHNLLDTFVVVEVILAFVGGVSSIILFAVYPISGMYVPVAYLLILIIGTLVGLEIPIVVRVLSSQKDLRKGVADTLSLDYVGALLGSLAFPLLMLPYLGLFRSSFAIGLLNAVVALINTAAFRRYVRRPKTLFAAGVAVVLLLLVAFSMTSKITRYSENQLYGGRIVLKQQSPYQRIILTIDDTTGEHRLYLDGHIQFAEYDEYRYHEALVHPVMAAPGHAKRVLILGGGDGLAIREVLRFQDVEEVVLVDLDPAVVEMARTFPAIVRLNRGSLDDPLVTIINDDAFTFVRNGATLFDRIILDLPDPHNEALAKLYSVEFYTMIRKRLAPDGLMVTQSTSPYFASGVFWSIRDTIRAADLKTLSYHVNVPAFGQWGFHLASPREAPETFNFLPDARFMDSDIMAAAQVFSRDLLAADRQVNSIFEPGIYLQYRDALLRGRPYNPGDTGTQTGTNTEEDG